MNYQFSWLNNNVKLIDPVLTVDPVVHAVDPINMTIAVDITLTANGYTAGLRLEDVAVENLNYDTNTLEIRVLAKLEEYKVD